MPDRVVQFTTHAQERVQARMDGDIARAVAEVYAALRNGRSSLRAPYGYRQSVRGGERRPGYGGRMRWLHSEDGQRHYLADLSASHRCRVVTVWVMTT